MEKLSQLKVENKALQEEILRSRTVHQSAIDSLEQRLAIEVKYRESQQRFQTIFEQSKLGNKIIAKDLRIIQVNHALELMLGYSQKELVGTPVIAYAHPDYIQPWRELQQNLWAKSIPSFGIETLLLRKDGSLIWCHVTSILFSDGDDLLGYTILEDITERKALEEKLKKMYDSQETMMHTVSHDLKNPIHTIKTISGFLKKQVEAFQQIDNQKKTQSLTFIDMIAKSCDRAYHIIKDLLLIGEIELGKLTFKLVNTEMKGFIKAQLSLFEWEAKEKGIGIDFQFPPESVYAPINEEKFERVVENLLTNAIKFTYPGGQIMLYLTQEKGKVLFQVSDNGIGIPGALQSSVFQKFTKANRLGTQGEATTGLGLYIVKQIVDLHQGKIWLKSLENQGTSFYVELAKD